MDRSTAKFLIDLNTRFYAVSAASFSQTRNAPWRGWRRCLEACGIGLDAEQGSMHQRKVENLSVLDIACGNLRFERFLIEECPYIDWRLFALDNCEPLVESAGANLISRVHFTRDDIIGNLFAGLPAAEPANDGALAQAYPFDLVVSFGFMHHIPAFELRELFLREALSMTRPGGFMVISFWQFLNDAAKRARIEQTHEEALAHLAEAKGSDLALDRDDRLLGWKGAPELYRYCHHFTNEEIERLIDVLEPHVRTVSAFSADGKSGEMNRYVILQRC